MKNKLLLSSALLGSLVIGSAAYSQTTITGNLSLSYKSISEHTALTAANNNAAIGTGTNTAARSFGRESQINFANKGKLNNGMDYAAGFSLENDGGQVNDLSNENVFIDFISGNTTLTIGQDHIQNTNRTRGNFVGNDATDLATGNPYEVLNANVGFIQSAGSNPAQSMGVGVVQNTPIGSLSFLYVPTVGNSGSDNEVGNRDGAAAINLESDNESAIEVGYAGDLGVKGLSAHAFYNVENERVNESGKRKGKNLGVSYNFGATTIGFNRKENDTPVNAATQTELRQHEFGIAYSATPNLTLAANYTTAKVEGSAVANVITDDATSKSLSVGYNLGPIAVIAQVARQENIAQDAPGSDQDVVFIKLNTNF
jgi:hypothetical protein